MRHDVAKHFQALANELCSLLYVWIEHVEVADVLITNVTRPRSHAWATEKPLHERSTIRSHHAPEAALFCLWQWLSRCWVESVESLGASSSRAENLLRTEATARQCFVCPPFSLTLGLVRDLEMLGRQQLMWVLRVRVWIIVLIL